MGVGNKMKKSAILRNFTISITKSGFRDYKSLLLTLGLPMFMLFTFWVTTRDGSKESEELLHGMVPAICALSVMMGGQTQATRLVKWKEEGSLKRLFLSPFPIELSILGLSVSQVLTMVVQGLLFSVISFPLLGMTPNLQMLFWAPIVMVVVAITFTALGTLLSSVMKKSYLTGYIFFGIFMPMFFVGSFPKEALPDFIGNNIVYLPTTMGINLVHNLFESSSLVTNSVYPLIGLVGYTVLFSILSILIYRRSLNGFNR